MTWQEKCFQLWGEQWKAVLARTMMVSKRVIQKWASDHHQIQCPDDVQNKINKTYEIWVE